MNEYKNFLTFGIMILIVIALIVVMIIYDKKIKDGGADERQVLFQGKASYYGLIAILFSNFLSFEAIRIFNFNFHTEIFFLISIMIGGAVFLIVGIWKDSVINKIENKKVWTIIGLGWLCAIFKTVYNVTKSTAIENKIILVSEIVVTVAIIITICIKCLANKNKAEDDE